jgi:ribonucleoside-diphosphate reductase alpha chain
MDIYTAAWDKGVKTTYYLHMKPRHTAEQSTVRVNKAEKLGKKGFGSVATKMAPAPVEVKKPGFAVPLQKSLEIDGVQDMPVPKPFVSKQSHISAEAHPSKQETEKGA